MRKGNQIMNSTDKSKVSWKKKLLHEMVEYWINVIYLTLVFAAFTVYRRLILAAHDITYTNYGFAVIEALVLAKVIMIGDVVRLGRGLEQKPLIYPTLYKTAVFTLFLGIFTVLENVVKVLWKGTGFTGDLVDFLGKGSHEFIANALIVFVAFIPFFGVKELGRVIGQDKIRALFFRKRDLEG
jgi:hypothetical protein